MIFFDQDLFAMLLCLERKRCERSGERFGLALLEVSSLVDAAPLRDAICSKLRATDIAGWYQEQAVIGIIFTTLNSTPSPHLRSMLRTKVDNALYSILMPDELHKVSTTIRIFPEDVSQELYPDLRTGKRNSSYHAIKRGIDILCSLTALILLLPAFLVIGILIKLSSPGPVLFRQKRLGLFGRPFDFLKFRTMHANNDPSIHIDYVIKLIQGRHETSESYKIRDDPRVTPVGRILRRYSLDELPQFINVLKGEMSLVGPRPPIPYEMETYRCWHRRRVLEAKPGLTGLWQVQGRSRTTFDDMVRMDIRYIQQQCFWLDFKIMLKTPLVVLSGTGAY
jgi:exopolysaccharide biosynthesis polyprenyl glycosylphosphotransferase